MASAAVPDKHFLHHAREQLPAGFIEASRASPDHGIDI